MGETLVRVERRGAITTVDGPSADMLKDAFRHFDADPSQKVAVLWGAHGTFCAGAVLTALDAPGRAHDLDPEGAATARSGRRGWRSASRRSRRSPATPGGLELFADLRVVEEGAVFGVFCRRFGVPPIEGMGRTLDMIPAARSARRKRSPSPRQPGRRRRAVTRT